MDHRTPQGFPLKYNQMMLWEEWREFTDTGNPTMVWYQIRIAEVTKPEIPGGAEGTFFTTRGMQARVEQREELLALVRSGSIVFKDEGSQMQCLPLPTLIRGS